MPNLKDIKRRIGSVKSAQQITKAMKLIAAARLKKAQAAVDDSRPYAIELERIAHRVACGVDATSHPLMGSPGSGASMIILCSGDKGLCGAFNSNLFKEARSLIDSLGSSDIKLTLVGRKGVDHYRRRGYPISGQFLDYGKNLSAEFARSIADHALGEYLSGSVSRIYLIYSRFKSVATHIPTSLMLAPLRSIAQEEDGSSADGLIEYEYEPSRSALFDSVARLYIENQIFIALIESAASENGARMTAMDAATKNAKEMIESLTLTFNRARQAAITTEIIEIVSGADALEG